MTPPVFSERTMTSVCYDGQVIRTPWSVDRRWLLPAQVAQAEDHRRRVLDYLNRNRLRRLIPVQVAA